MKSVSCLVCLCAILSVSATALAVPDVEFNPDASGWEYDGAGTFTFSDSVSIRRVQGATGDTLVGNFVEIPDLVVSGLPGGPYALTASGFIKIVDGGGGTLLTGTLNGGDLVPVGTIGVAYAQINADITNVTINNTIGSTLLTDWDNAGNGIDFNLSIDSNINIAAMLSGGLQDGNGFSGSMTMIPEPATVAILGLGAACMSLTSRRRRRRATA